MTVLVPVDGSDPSLDALEFAVERAEQADDHLHVVHVKTESDWGADHIADVVEERVDDVVSNVGVSYDLQLVGDDEGSPGSEMPVAEVLLELVAVNEYSHIVMGREQKSRFQKLVFGSTSDRVLESRNIPVTVVP